jgi:anti-sigma factor RsiW
MTDQMLEILIGKHIDGEITPAEQRILKAALQEDSGARELFEQLQDLHQSAHQVVAAEIGERARTADEIFEQARQRQARRPARRMIELRGYWRFAAGLAAGLIIGLSLHFVLLRHSEAQSEPRPPVTTAQESSDLTDVRRPALPMLRPDGTENVIRNIDWYSFTDETGDQWLIEGLRESSVRPAVYYGDL